VIILSNEKIHTLSGSLIVFSFSSKPTLDNLEIFCNFTGVDLYNLTEYLSSLIVIINYIKTHTNLCECLDKGFSGLWWILLYKLDDVFNWYFNTLIYNNSIY